MLKRLHFREGWRPLWKHISSAIQLPMPQIKLWFNKEAFREHVFDNILLEKVGRSKRDVWASQPKSDMGFSKSGFWKCKMTLPKRRIFVKAISVPSSKVRRSLWNLGGHVSLFAVGNL